MVNDLPAIGRRAPWVKTDEQWHHILLQAPGYEPKTGLRALCISDPGVQLALHLFCAAPQPLPMMLGLIGDGQEQNSSLASM
jgi:hypothetical protein